MYNFGNMNRDQHQGRDDDDQPEQSGPSGSGPIGWVLILIIVLVIGIYLYFRNLPEKEPASSVNNSAPARNQNNTANRTKPESANRPARSGQQGR